MRYAPAILMVVPLAAALAPPGGSSLAQQREQSNLALLATVVAAQPVYYVSDTGNDINPGTSTAPFLTLQRAADRVRPGDTVEVRAGVYAGFNLNAAGGTEGRPVTFIAEPHVTIRTAAKKGPNPDSGINIEHAGGTAWVVIRGFDIDGQDGSMKRAGIRLTGCSHVQVCDCTIENSQGNWGIFVSLSNDLLVEHNTCRNSGGQHGIYVCRGSKRITIRGNVLAGNNWDGLHLNGGMEGPIDHCTIESNVIFDNRLSGVDCDGVHNSVFRNNVVYGNDKHAITLYNHDTPTGCFQNVLTNNALISRSMFAVQMQPGSTDNIFRCDLLFQQGPSNYGSIGIRGDASGLVSDYNVVVDRFSTDLGLKVLSLAQWRRRTRQDTHSLNLASVTDIFVKLVGGDYHLCAPGPGARAVR